MNIYTDNEGRLKKYGFCLRTKLKNLVHSMRIPYVKKGRPKVCLSKEEQYDNGIIYAVAFLRIRITILILFNIFMYMNKCNFNYLNLFVYI